MLVQQKDVHLTSSRVYCPTIVPLKCDVDPLATRPISLANMRGAQQCELVRQCGELAEPAEASASYT
jgi:hypothetical protein